MTDKSKRGFASMDKDRQREIARKGGQSVPNEKRSFSTNPELAAQAGHKGGRVLLLRTEASRVIANWLLLPVGKAEKPRIAAILPNLSEACGAPITPPCGAGSSGSAALGGTVRPLLSF